MDLFRDLIKKYIKKFNLERVESEIFDLIKPCIRILPKSKDDDELKIGQSKFGGFPDVPPNFKWPISHNMPQMFIGQINLAEIADYHLDLPRIGILSFFLDCTNDSLFGKPNEENDSSFYVYRSATGNFFF